jgi:hypothetical protein
MTRDQLMDKAAARDKDFKTMDLRTARIQDSSRGRGVVLNEELLAIDDGFNEIMTLMGAPVGFVKKTHVDLADQIVKRLSQDAGDKEILLKGGRIIGNRPKGGGHVSSEEVCSKILKNVPDVEKVLFFDLGKSFDVQILCHSLEVKPKKDDIVRGGLRFLYSEFMLREPEISAFSERLVCLNGMTHRESRMNFKFETYQKFMEELDMSINVCLNYFQSNVGENLKKAVEMKAPGDQIIRQAFSRNHVNARFFDDVLAAHALENDGSAYGVLQAFTRAANVQNTYQNRSLLQEVGGIELLEVSRAHCPTCYSTLN